MAKFWDVFDPITNRRQKVFLVVIHAESSEQAVRNATIAFENGADGIWLVNHSIEAVELDDCYEAVRRKYPTSWIGLNYIDANHPVQAFDSLPESANGIWFDYAGYDEKSTEPAGGVQMLQELHQEMAPQALLFGGVAHKGNPPVRDVVQAARLAAPLLDALVTTGPATGIAADIEKIMLMKQAMGKGVFALASGVTVQNIRPYLPWVDVFMINTGISISKSFTELDPEKVAAMSRIIQNVR